MVQKHIVLVTGGQRSGKSNYAMRRALAETPHPVYLATARVWDDEFRQRVQRHQADRGPAWTSLEEEKWLSRCPINDRVVVIDCVTQSDVERSLSEMKAEFERLAEHNAYLIIVTNEIGLGGISTDPVQRKFTDLQGWMNQYIAARADEVVLMVSGIPFTIKSV